MSAEDQINRQIDAHQSILDTHSVLPRDFHEGCIRGLIDARLIIEQQQLDLEQRLEINTLIKGAVGLDLCAVMMLEAAGYRLMRRASACEDKSEAA